MRVDDEVNSKVADGSIMILTSPTRVDDEVNSKVADGSIMILNVADEGRR